MTQVLLTCIFIAHHSVLTGRGRSRNCGGVVRSCCAVLRDTAVMSAFGEAKLRPSLELAPGSEGCEPHPDWWRCSEIKFRTGWAGRLQRAPVLMTAGGCPLANYVFRNAFRFNDVFVLRQISLWAGPDRNKIANMNAN